MALSIVCQPAIEQGEKQRLLAFKVMIERALADACVFANIIHAGGSVAMRGRII